MEVGQSTCATAIIKSASPTTDIWPIITRTFKRWRVESGFLLMYIHILQTASWPVLDLVKWLRCISRFKHTSMYCLTQVLFWHLSFPLCQDEGLAIHEILRELESQCLSEISAMLNGEIPGEELGDLFFDCVDTEIKFYQWGGGRLQEL